MSKSPLLGDPFPTLEVQTTHGAMTLPEVYAGKWFVLFSYPADFTPVCTTEVVAFQHRQARFKLLGTEVIGLSLDQVYSHIQWIRWIKAQLKVEVSFPLIADDYGGISTVLGLIHPAMGTNTVRGLFVVDPQGITRAALVYPHELGRNLDEVIRMVEGLQLADRERVLVPAGWPANEIVGSNVVLEPPRDLSTPSSLPENAETLDWWFNHAPPRH